MNREKWKNLNTRERLIKIAELDDWTYFGDEDKFHKNFRSIGHHDGTAWGIDGLPDYLNDLNETHRFTKLMNRKQKIHYIDWLMDIACDNDGGAFEATAAQRTEAFILTMEPEHECTCPKECDCEDYENGLVSNLYPEHNIIPIPDEECPIHGG